MGVLKELNRKLGKIEAFLISWAVIGMAIVLIANAVGRTVFQHSFRAAEEVSQFLVLLTTFFGLSNAARHGKHVAMTAVFDGLPEGGKRVIGIIVSGFTALFLVGLTYLSAKYVVNLHEFGRITPALRVPYWIVVSVMPIGCALAALQYFTTCLMNIFDKETVYIGTEAADEPETL